MYKIKRGDTLSQIAVQYGVTVADLKKWNNLTDNSINEGKYLLIVTSDDNSAEQNTRTTATPEISRTSASASESGGNTLTGTVHTVVSGDTLSGIAQRYGVPQAAIEEANPNLTSPDRLSLGQQIRIPAAEEDASTEVDNERNSELSVSSNEIAGLYDEVYDLVPEEYESYISQIADNAGVSEDLVRMFIINEGQVCNTGEQRGKKAASLKAYHRNGDVWTIGFGHTNLCRNMDFRVQDGVTITLDYAFQLLEDDIIEMKRLVRHAVGEDAFDNAPQAIQDLFVEYAFQNGPNGKLKSANLKANLSNEYYEAIASGSLFDGGFNRRSGYRFMLAISDFTIEQQKNALARFKEKGHYQNVLSALSGTEKQTFINFCRQIENA